MLLVFWHMTNILSLLNMSLNIICDKSRKFVLLRSPYNLSVLNMDWKHDLRKVMK